MNIRIEEAFHDCFERMLSGESLESCLSRYPEYAAELNTMLRTSYDIKRKAYPIQPRPEFKYWARVRMQNVQQYGVQPAKSRSSSFNLRRNLAISLAALLVFTIASSGTVAASSDAMPDEPLYGVKMVVEQAQVTLAPSEAEKAEVYARLTEKRAQEIAVMANKGKDDKVIATTKMMNYQLQQLEINMARAESEYAADVERASAYAAANPQAKPFTAVVPPAAPNTTVVPPATPGVTALPPIPVPPSATGTAVVPPFASANNTRKFAPPAVLSGNQTTTANAQDSQNAKRILSIQKARETINNSTAKSLTILQGALDKAPASVKSNLNNAISETLTTNKRIQLENTRNSGAIKRGMQNTDNDTDNDNDDDNDNGRPSGPTIKPNFNKNPLVNPTDRPKIKTFNDTDNRIVK